MGLSARRCRPASRCTSTAPARSLSAMRAAIDGARPFPCWRLPMGGGGGAAAFGRDGLRASGGSRPRHEPCEVELVHGSQRGGSDAAESDGRLVLTEELGN
jgi:hypothetical protein